MKNEEFQSINVDLNILIRKNYNKIIIINIYINDLLIANKTIQKIYCTKTVLNEAFKMLNLEKAQIIVDLKIIRNKNKHILMLNQTSYIMKVLLEEKMKNYSHIKIFIKSKSFIILNKINNIMKTNLTNIQQIVEKLMYIACNT